MSILTGFKKVKNYILTSSGYQLLSRWTSSQTVEFDDGKTAQAKLGEINGIAKTYVDMKKATDNSMAVSAKAVMEGLENSSALISMTQAEYDALSDEEKTDNNMRAILDANPDVVDAKNVNFDNTNTNLIATNTQSAITELNGKLSINRIERITDNKLHNINFKNYAKITAVAIIKTQENMYLSYSFDIPTETLSAAYGYWTQGHYKTSSDTSSCVLYMNQSNIRFVEAYYCGNSVKLDSLEIYAAK